MNRDLTPSVAAALDEAHAVAQVQRFQYVEHPDTIPMPLAALEAERRRLVEERRAALLADAEANRITAWQWVAWLAICLFAIVASALYPGQWWS